MFPIDHTTPLPYLELLGDPVLDLVGITGKLLEGLGLAQLRALVNQRVLQLVPPGKEEVTVFSQLRYIEFSLLFIPSGMETITIFRDF